MVVSGRSPEQGPVGDATIPYPTLLARLTPQSPLPFWKGQAAALATVAVAMGLRWGLEPVLGDEISFTTLFPALLVSTMLAGAPGAITTIVGGAIASLTISALGEATPQLIRDATPRLVVWLLVGGLMTAMSLALRTTIVALRRRQIELSEAKERQEVLTRELEHRGRNALTILQGLSLMTARSVDSVEAYRRELSRRIVAMSSAYSLLVREPDRPRSLDGLVREILAGFGDQIRFSPAKEVFVPPKVCVSLALALHELASWRQCRQVWRTLAPRRNGRSKVGLQLRRNPLSTVARGRRSRAARASSGRDRLADHSPGVPWRAQERRPNSRLAQRA